MEEEDGEEGEDGENQSPDNDENPDKHNLMNFVLQLKSIADEDDKKKSDWILLQ